VPIRDISRIWVNPFLMLSEREAILAILADYGVIPDAG
jgi:hypothetical protein